MPKTSLQTSFLLTTALLGACFSGPNQLEYYAAPALTVHARFPGLSTGYNVYPSLDIGKISSHGYDLTGQQDRLPPTQYGIRGEMKPGGEAQFTVNAGGSRTNPMGDFSPIRFFRLGVSFSETETVSTQDTWAPEGYDLVWAVDVTTYFPSGPTYPSVTFPKGYSWLHRQCGPSPGQILIDVRPIEETVVFQKVDRFSPWDDFYLESSERRFVESCGTVIPAQDLGMRISFDRASAQPLVWAVDGTSLYYLSEADAEDPTKAVGLRRIRLADGVSAELVTVPWGRDLQQDATGQLYVTTGSELALVSRPASGPATLVDLPFPGTGRVSPDGQWIARDTYAQGGVSTILWSVSAGVEVATLAGTLVDWSPDSKLLYRTPVPPALNLISPANPTLPTVYPDQGNPAWSAQGPVWVTLTDLVEGSERKVLEASDGRSYPVSIPPILDTYLVWATTCLGLHDTVCNYSLIRINPTTGATQTIAVAADQYPIGLSSDGKHFAIAAPSGIYVKTLSP